MALKCNHCGSADTAAGLTQYECLACGELSGFDGSLGTAGPDENTRNEIMRRLEPKGPTIVGNLADLQRSGMREPGKSRGDAATTSSAPKSRTKK